MKSPNDFDDLFAQLRQAPPDADPAHVAAGLETRVAARIRAERADDGQTWFWRWSLLFGCATAVCTGILVYNIIDATTGPLAVFDDGTMILVSLF